MSSKHNKQSLSQIRHKDTPLIPHPPSPYSHNVPTTPLPVRNESRTPHPPSLHPHPHPPSSPSPSCLSLLSCRSSLPCRSCRSPHHSLLTYPSQPRRGVNLVNPRQRRGNEHYTETVPAGLYPHILLPPSLSTPLITPTTIAPQSPGPNYHKPPRACPWACFAPTGAR